MEQFESMTRKVVGNIKKYSVIEFYHEESGLLKKISQLFDSLEQFNAYLPNSVIVQKDLKKVQNDVKVDLRERLNSYIQKVNHDFALKNYQFIVD